MQHKYAGDYRKILDKVVVELLLMNVGMVN